MLSVADSCHLTVSAMCIWVSLCFIVSCGRLLGEIRRECSPTRVIESTTRYIDYPPSYEVIVHETRREWNLSVRVIKCGACIAIGASCALCGHSLHVTQLRRIRRVRLQYVICPSSLVLFDSLGRSVVCCELQCTRTRPILHKHSAEEMLFSIGV